MQHRRRHVDRHHLAFQVAGRLDRILEVVAQDQGVTGVARPVAGARHDDAHRPIAREGIVERGADAAADHLDLVGRERRRRLGGRIETLERDVEFLGGEVALFDRDIEGRIGDDAELADLDRLSGCGGGPQAEQPGEKQSMHMQHLYCRQGIRRRSSSCSKKVARTPRMVTTMMPTNMFSTTSVSHDVQIR